MISKIKFWNLFTCKGTYMIDCAGDGSPVKARWMTVLFGPFLSMTVANLCSRRKRHLRTQARC